MEFAEIVLPIVSIIALILGPLLAAGLVIWRDHYVRKEANLRDEKLEKKNRQMAIFRTLWTNRTIIKRTASSQQILERVEALNLVPVVFYENEKIHKCWTIYMKTVDLDSFLNAPMIESVQEYQNLLKSIADYLGYQFSSEDISLAVKI